MTILVVGGAGYIGSHTVKALQAVGHTVWIFDSLEKGYLEAVARLGCSERLILGNINDTETLANAFATAKPDAVIHFAAYIEAGESVKEPAKFFTNNVAGSLNLFSTMLNAGVHNLVFSSTAAVYGEPKRVPIPETAEKQPTNPYGTSKYLVEQAIADLTAHTPLKATILRYFNASGDDPEGQIGEAHSPETHLIPLVLQVALGQRDHIKILGTDYPTPDGTCIRDYIHVTDLAQAHVTALDALLQRTAKLATYNVGTGNGYSVKQIIDTCREVTHHPIPAKDVPRRPGDPSELVADSAKIRQELGWTPKHSDLETIITTAWQWHKTHPNGYNTSK